MSEKPLTTTEAAAVLGITPHGVRHLIRAGRLAAELFGRDYLIRPTDLKKIRYGKAGRPKSQAG